MFEIKQAHSLAIMLDRVVASIETLVHPITAQMLLSVTGALLALWLMQAMTVLAGFNGVVPLLRLAQRCSLAWLALGLMLNSVAPYLGSGAHQDLIRLVVITAVVLLLAASVLLVHINPPKTH